MISTKIEIPDKGTIYLVSDGSLDEFTGDEEVVNYLRTLFKNAEKSKLTYHWNDHATVETELIKEKDIFNCDAIMAVLEHNKIPIPDDFPTQAMREMEKAKSLGGHLIY